VCPACARRAALRQRDLALLQLAAEVAQLRRALALAAPAALAAAAAAPPVQGPGPGVSGSAPSEQPRPGPPAGAAPAMRQPEPSPGPVRSVAEPCVGAAHGQAPLVTSQHWRCVEHQRALQQPGGPPAAPHADPLQAAAPAAGKGPQGALAPSSPAGHAPPLGPPGGGRSGARARSTSRGTALPVQQLLGKLVSLPEGARGAGAAAVPPAARLGATRGPGSSSDPPCVSGLPGPLVGAPAAAAADAGLHASGTTGGPGLDNEPEAARASWDAQLTAAFWGNEQAFRNPSPGLGTAVAGAMAAAQSGALPAAAPPPAMLLLAPAAPGTAAQAVLLPEAAAAPAAPSSTYEALVPMRGQAAGGGLVPGTEAMPEQGPRYAAGQLLCEGPAAEPFGPAQGADSGRTGASSARQAPSGGSWGAAADACLAASAGAAVVASQVQACMQGAASAGSILYAHHAEQPGWGRPQQDLAPDSSAAQHAA